MTIRDICGKYDYTQTDIAIRFGIPLRTVQGWYIGERTPPQYVVYMMDEILRRDEKNKRAD